MYHALRMSRITDRTGKASPIPNVSKLMQENEKLFHNFVVQTMPNNFNCGFAKNVPIYIYIYIYLIGRKTDNGRTEIC